MPTTQMSCSSCTLSFRGVSFLPQILGGCHYNELNSSFISENIVSPATNGTNAFNCCNAVIRDEDFLDDMIFVTPKFFHIGSNIGKSSVIIL